MKISFDGVGQWGATFGCADVTEGRSGDFGRY